eukprot:scaffold1729_cov173-Ochromonas_danica.AAC.6
MDQSVNHFSQSRSSAVAGVVPLTCSSCGSHDGVFPHPQKRVGFDKPVYCCCLLLLPFRIATRKKFELVSTGTVQGWLRYRMFYKAVFAAM